MPSSRSRAASRRRCHMRRRRRSSRREGRHDHGERDDRPRHPCREDGQAGPPSPSRERVPEPEPRDPSPMSSPQRSASTAHRSRTARAGRSRGTRCRRGRAGSRASPGGRRRRPSTRPRGRRGTESEDGGHALGTRVAAGEPEHREGAEATATIWTATSAAASEREPERREHREDRIDVASETDHLLARRAVRHLERPSVGGAPDRLHHVSEVVAAFAELHVMVTHDEEQRDSDQTNSAAHTKRGQACSLHEHGPCRRFRAAALVAAGASDSVIRSRPQRRIDAAIADTQLTECEREGRDRGRQARRTSASAGMPTPGDNDRRERNEPRNPRRGRATATATISSAK